MIKYDIRLDGNGVALDFQPSWRTVDEAAEDLAPVEFDTAWLSDDGNSWTLRKEGGAVSVEESGWVGSVRGLMPREEYECILEFDGPDALAAQLKLAEAHKLSGYSDYPSTMADIQACVSECFGDRYDEVFDSMEAWQLGRMFELAKFAYERGRDAER